MGSQPLPWAHMGGWGWLGGSCPGASQGGSVLSCLSLGDGD